MFSLYFANATKHYSSPTDQQVLLTKIQEFLDPWGGLAATYTMAYIPFTVKDGLSEPLLRKVNALAIWDPGDDWSALHSNLVIQLANQIHKDIAWPVAPAFYQRRAGGDPMEYANEFGAARYIDAWMQALKIHPAIIDVQTWNDFSEDSSIRSTDANGDTYLDLTTYFTKWIDSGSQPPITKDTVMLFHPKQLTNAQLDDPSAKATNAAWRHRTPIVNYIDCVTFLKQESTVRVSLGDQHWEQKIPSGFHDWVIYVPRQAAPDQKDQVAETDSSYPTQSSMRFVTIATRPFSPSVPEVTLTRERAKVLSLKSKYAFLARGQFQDLTVIGDETSN